MEKQKKSVMPTLRGMKVGEIQSYPIERLLTIRVQVGRLNLQSKRIGCKWTTRTNGLNVEVKRIH